MDVNEVEKKNGTWADFIVKIGCNQESTICGIYYEEILGHFC